MLDAYHDSFVIDVRRLVSLVPLVKPVNWLWAPCIILILIS